MWKRVNEKTVLVAAAAAGAAVLLPLLFLSNALPRAEDASILYLLPYFNADREHTLWQPMCEPDCEATVGAKTVGGLIR